MTSKWTITGLCLLTACSLAATQTADWWHPGWRLRTTVTRPTPYRDNTPRPIEVAVDFPLLMAKARVHGEFDPASLRIIEGGREVPSAYRTEFDPRQAREQAYLTWTAHPTLGQVGACDVYFDTKERGIEPPDYDGRLLPPESLLTNSGFEGEADGLPSGWKVSPQALVGLGRFAHTTGQRSLRIQVDENTPKDAGREVVISQMIDVREFAGQEMLFECDLLAERAPYGAPVCIQLRQFRADGSRIPEYAIQSRWLTVELAEGQLVQFRERGRFSHEAASADVRVAVRCHVRDADTWEYVTGPESSFTVWLDRLVVRPGERWPWPAASNAGFVEGAMEKAPLNRGFEFTGLRRLAFNGASEGTLTAREYNPDPKSVHWGLQSGTLEFWCRPSWNADDGLEHIFFYGTAYGHRLQSRLRKRNAEGKNELEFVILDADRKAHAVGGPASLKAGQWHHIAATWDLPKAQLQLFANGKRVGSEGPGADPWPFSLVHTDKEKQKGIGISETDTRSMPMQAFIGGDKTWTADRAAEAVVDEFRISDAVRYTDDFTPSREEFAVDDNTRALFHFENERHGVHSSDDRFVRGYLGCELPPQKKEAVLEVLNDGKVERRVALVKPHASPELFEASRAENRMTVTRPFRELPDPRFVQYRRKRVERTVTGADEGFVLDVGGDLEPLMRCVTFEHADTATAQTTFLPRWRANDNVIPFSAQSIAATLAPDATSDAEKALAIFRYALQVTNYYDAHYCETLPCGRHRPRIAYTFIKAVNIYPFDQCGPLNYILRKLFLAAGISSNDAPGTHHQFEQCFYDGSLRLCDLSPRQYWLSRDNATRISLRGLGEDPYLKLRQGGAPNAWLPGRRSTASFGTAVRPHSMDFGLRPGERASICWHNEGRWFELTGNREPIPLAKIPPYFGNGEIVYEPSPEGEAAELNNLAIERIADGSSVLRAQDPAKPASLIYRAQCPYIFSDGSVSGVYEAGAPAAIGMSVSFDEGKTWTEVWKNPTPADEFVADLVGHVSARYAYWLRIEIAPGQGTTLRDLKVRTVFVASPLALPGKLSLGENRISFVGAKPTVPIKTSCSWVERHQSDLGVSLNALSYYNMDDEAHRNVFVVAPGGEAQVEVTLEGRRLRGDVSLEGLPAGWTAEPERKRIELPRTDRPVGAEFVLRPGRATEGDIETFEIVIRDGDNVRRVLAQALVANAALVREAELADELSGAAASVEMAELSGARGVTFESEGQLAFDFSAPAAGKHALWLRARWEAGSSTRMELALDDTSPRDLRASAMIGFTEWKDPKRAHAKMFAHYGEQYSHWNWYRVPDVELATGKHRLTLSAHAGARFDALALLPQNPVMDRAAMNLFQNWNYAPWDNPL